MSLHTQKHSYCCDIDQLIPLIFMLEPGAGGLRVLSCCEDTDWPVRHNPPSRSSKSGGDPTNPAAQLDAAYDRFCPRHAELN